MPTEEKLSQQYLESDRALYQKEQERERERESEPGHKMGPGSYVLLLFSFCVDILEIIITYTGVGAPIAIIAGFVIDIVIFTAIGLSKKAQKQWKRFAIGFVGENFPLFSSLIEIIPVRTLALIWMYRGMSKPPEKEPEKMNDQRIPPANQPSAPSDSQKNNGKTDSMSIHDELWELNAKPNLSKEDKERLQKAYWIMEHNHIEDKEKNDPVFLRAFERANRGEVIFDGSPEKRHGFKFSNVQIVNATNTIAGRDFDSLNPQYGNKEKK